jgi:RsiW-degrading membrane proteinase PrsW (M82 family)
MSVERETCRLPEIRSQRRELYLLTLVVGLVGTVLAGLANVAVIAFLDGSSISAVQQSPGRLISKYSFVAGFTEEILKNVGAAVIVLGFASRVERHDCVDLGEVGWKVGFILGVEFAVLELYNKLLIYGNGSIDHVLFWMDPGFTPGMLFPVAMHVVLGIVGGAIVGRLFADREIEQREYLVLAVTYLGLAFFHGYVYNQWFTRFIPEILNTMGV